jgi:hypothetical protein
MAICFSPFVRAPRPGLITTAEILTRGYDPEDFDFEQIKGVFYGRRRGAEGKQDRRGEYLSLRQVCHSSMRTMSLAAALEVRISTKLPILGSSVELWSYQ